MTLSEALNCKKQYCVGFLFNDDMSLVLLIHKTNPKWQAGHWNGVGGKIEQGENSRDAMIREFKEETGQEVRNWNKFDVLPGINPDGEHRVLHFFYAIDGNALFSTETQTEEGIFIFSVDALHDVPGGVIDNLLWLIPKAMTMRNKDICYITLEVNSLEINNGN